MVAQSQGKPLSLAALEVQLESLVALSVFHSTEFSDLMTAVLSMSAASTCGALSVVVVVGLVTAFFD